MEIAVLHMALTTGINTVLLVNVKRGMVMANVTTKNPKSGATRIKRNVARKRFTRNA